MPCWICYGRAKVIVGPEPIRSSRKIAAGSLRSAVAGAKITVGFFVFLGMNIFTLFPLIERTEAPGDPLVGLWYQVSHQEDKGESIMYCRLIAGLIIIALIFLTGCWDRQDQAW